MFRERRVTRARNDLEQHSIQQSEQMLASASEIGASRRHQRAGDRRSASRLALDRARTDTLYGLLCDYDCVPRGRQTALES